MFKQLPEGQDAALASIPLQTAKRSMDYLPDHEAARVIKALEDMFSAQLARACHREGLSDLDHAMHEVGVEMRNEKFDRSSARQRRAAEVESFGRELN